jgi:hypothetical protein
MAVRALLEVLAIQVIQGEGETAVVLLMEAAEVLGAVAVAQAT